MTESTQTSDASTEILKAADPGATCWPKVCELYEAGKTNEAIALASSAKCQDSQTCRNFVGWRLYEGHQYVEALEQFMVGATLGDAEAFFGLGCVRFAQTEYAMALSNFENAARLGCQRAHHWAGGMYRDGIGVDADFDKAIDHFKRGAAAGYLIARRGLIHLQNKKYGVLKTISNAPEYLFIIDTALALGIKDPNDDRLVDAPNRFERYAWYPDFIKKG